MRHWALYFVCFALALIAIVPIIHTSTDGAFIASLDQGTVAGCNFVAWALVIALLVSREDLRRAAVQMGKLFGLNGGQLSLEEIVRSLLFEVDRKAKAFSSHLIEGKVVTKEQLSESLERIVARAYTLFNANSAELALFDEEAGLYHSSFVIGKPFGSGAQAMLCQAAGASDYEISPDVLVQPIAFAGSILGSLRVSLKDGALPTTADRELIKLLALLSGLAIINAQYTQELVRMKRSSDESVKAKTGFLANLSHEIRGPLGIILNAVELVLDGLCGELNADQTETLQMIRSNSDHLLELINDVLDYAKIESGKIHTDTADVLVNELLLDLTQVVRTQAESKGHKLIYRPCDDALAFQCDRRHVRQMLINLLTNAIKYTPDQGTIVVSAERIPGNKIRMMVKDSGVGIEEADRAKVFEAFERINNTYSINQVGTGLGMPLTKRLAEVNGGTVDFESTPGIGSMFWLQFSATEFSPFMKHERNVDEPDAVGNDQVILVMEHDSGERSMITRYLNYIGFRVVTAETRDEVEHALASQPVQLALLDNESADRDGGEIVTLLRGGKGIRIVLASSRAFTFDVEKYLKSGIDRCLSKPVPLKELGHTCREVIDGSGSVKKQLRRTARNTPRNDTVH